MENDLTSFQQLDTVLNFLAENSFGKGGLNLVDALRLINEHTKLKTDGDLLLKILNHLFKDRYIETEVREVTYSTDITSRVESVKLYTVSFEGKVFNQAGGYEEKYKLLHLKRQQDEARLQREEGSQKRLNTLTFWLVVGSFSLAIVEVIKLFLRK
jgi:hypothetical protein